MFGSLRLGKLFGIDLFVHGTFWLLPLFVLFSGVAEGDLSGGALDVAVLFAVFGCVALHEVGHSLAARGYGIGTRDITLYPIGGVASLERMPERPWQEVVIALAGPAVNVVIAVGLGVGALLAGIMPPTYFGSALDPVAYLVWTVFAANVFLLVFNLIPAFPMDGGRVFRALLSLGLPRLGATRAAVTVGSILAAVGVFVGLFGLPGYGIRSGNLSLVLVSGVVFLLGQAELAAVRVQEARKRWRWYAEPAYEPARWGEPAEASLFTGWRWDPARRVWSEWQDGVLVREVSAS